MSKNFLKLSDRRGYMLTRIEIVEKLKKSLMEANQFNVEMNEEKRCIQFIVKLDGEERKFLIYIHSNSVNKVKKKCKDLKNKKEGIKFIDWLEDNDFVVGVEYIED